jgi:hypothetical protein
MLRRLKIAVLVHPDMIFLAECTSAIASKKNRLWADRIMRIKDRPVLASPKKMPQDQ